MFSNAPSRSTRRSTRLAVPLPAPSRAGASLAPSRCLQEKRRLHLYWLSFPPMKRDDLARQARDTHIHIHIRKNGTKSNGFPHLRGRRRQPIEPAPAHLRGEAGSPPPSLRCMCSRLATSARLRSHRTSVRNRPSCSAKNGIFEPFVYKNDHFAKTGSGQT